MNRIYLDKLLEFTNNTYKTYNQFVNTKKNNLNDIIESIKQNNSLNEKGISNKYNFIEINNIIPNFEFNELLLLTPIPFNIYENINWYNLLNSLLLILNNEYIHETNIKKKIILETTNNIYSKKINILNDLSEDFLLKVSTLTNICLIIISYTNNITNVKIYNEKENIKKYVVLFRDNENIFPVMNWINKYYDNSNQFIKYLINLSNNNTEINKLKNNNLNNLNDYTKIKKNKTNKNNKDNNDNKNDDEKNKKDDCYEELITNENYALYISEVTDIKKEKIKKNIISDSKKKSKNSKDIFIIKEENIEINNEENLEINLNKKDKKDKEVKQDKNNDDSTFKKTEILSKNKIEELIKSIKTTTTLSQIQEIALKLGIMTVSGSTKTGKPKNKTRAELIDEIKKKK